jgi:hypothetical protein
MNSLHPYARDRKTIQRTLLGLVLVLSLMIGNLPVAQAQGGGSELFSDAGAADVAPGGADHVLRSRLVNVNFGLLFDPNGKALDASVNPEITLNLFPDASYTGVIERVESNDSGGKTWTGRLKEREGFFFLVASEEAFVAHVASQEGIYEVSRAGDNLYKLVQIDQTKLGEDAPGLVDHADPVLLDENVDVAADAASTIDVMVVYTTAARIGSGGTAQIRAEIDLAMAETKQAYLNAGVIPSLRLVHVEEVAYAETGDIPKDLTRVLNPNDGILDNIHALRNLYGADMVAFIVENGGGFCGLAADILAIASTAFQVTQRFGCMTGYYSFAHEFAHLQGARHDLYMDPTTTPYAYGHGYVNTSARWRTVMAYGNKCYDSGFDCTRLPYFSNPNKSIGGAPAGQAGSAENFKVLNATAFTVANFRQTKIGKAFNSTFDTNANGWKAVAGTWLLGSSGGSGYLTSPGAAGIFSSAQFSTSYGDVTYRVRMLRKGCVGCPNSIFIRGNPASLTTNKSWRPSYQFHYNNAGNIAVWKVAPGGAVTILKNWTASSAVVKGGWNTLTVVAVGQSLKFYVNGTLVYGNSDTSYQVGKVGFGFFRNATSTGNRLYVDYARLTNTPTGGVAYDE